jgi:hypothetical protein
LPKFDRSRKFSISGKAIQEGTNLQIIMEFNGGLFKQPDLFELNSRNQDSSSY